jgi:hypothetical protein
MKLPASWPRIRPAPPDPRLDQILAAVRDLSTVTSTFFSNLNNKVNHIMLTQADVQAALATETTREGTIISLLTTAAANQKDLQAQLTAALAATDPAAQQAALQATLDTMNTNVANMDAAIASVQPPAPAAA